MIAQESKNDLRANPCDGFRRQIARTATGHGFFSIWMTVFSDDVAVRKLLIAEFRGTATDCFAASLTTLVRPRPPSGLAVQVLEVTSVHFGSSRGERRGGRVRTSKAEHLVSRGDEIQNDGGAHKASSAGNENTHQGFSLICLQDRNLSPLFHRFGD